MSIWSPLGFVVALLVRTGPALASDEPAAPTHIDARLEWTQQAGAESCMTAAELTDAVNRRWGRSVFVEGRADIVLVGNVGRSGREWRASLHLMREGGTDLGSRELTTRSPECSSLDDSVALAAGLMLDVSKQLVKERVEERRGEQTEAPPAPLPSNLVGGAPLSIPADTHAARAPWHLEPFVGIGAGIGALPGVSFAGRAGLALEPPGFLRIEAAFVATLPVERTTGTGSGVRIHTFEAELGACGTELGVPTFALEGCLFERVGEVRAEGFGFDQAGTVTDLLAAVGLSQRAVFELGVHFRLRVGAAVTIPLSRYRFVFEDSAPSTRVAYEMAPVNGSFWVDAGWRF